MNVNKSINVLQLGGPAGLYGAERWILALVRNLNPDEIKSIIAVVEDDPGLPLALVKQADNKGFQTHVFKAHGKFNLDVVTQLRDYILQNDIHILHTHQYKQDLIGLMAVRGTSCKIISTPHGWSRDAGIKLQCYEILDRLVFPFFDAVVPLSPDLMAPLKNIPFLKSKLHLIENGVDTTEIEECKTIAPELQDLKQRGYFIIGYIGQLIHRKGLDILLKAASQLDSDLKWKIALVGDGPQRKDLTRLAKTLGIEEHVNYYGFRNNRLEFLNGYDVFVLPSRLEGIPRCLMEALVSKTPVISSDIPGSVELIRQDKTGHLFKKENIKDLSKAIMHIVEHSDHAVIIAEHGYNYVIQNYSSIRMAEDYQKLYTKF